MKHGRYSKIKRERLRDLIAEHEADPDPLNLLPELAAARALFQDFMDRFEDTTDALLTWHESFQAGDETGEPKPRQVPDVADAQRLLSEITKIGKRIDDVRWRNALSKADLERLMLEMGRIVEYTAAEFLPDDTCESFLLRVRDRWMEIPVSI